MKTYPAVFHYDEGSYWVEFPDLEGCFSDGETIEEAAVNAAEALGGYLCSLMDRGLEIPTASSINDIKEPESGFRSIVTADPYAFKKNTKAVKKTLTIPQWLNDEAEQHNINFSQVLQKALIAIIQ